MNSYSGAAAWAWRDSATVRVLGSAASWFLFGLSFTLLAQVTTSVMAIGGSCASGGPYEIAVECPEAVALFAPLSIFGGLASVAIAILLAQGFGLQLTTWGWPILFCGLGIAFLLSNDPIGYLIGGLFLIMGLVPLVIEVRASPQRTLIGSRTASGLPLADGPNARPSMFYPGAPDPATVVPVTAPRVLAAVSIPVLFAVGGVMTGLILFTSVFGVDA